MGPALAGFEQRGMKIVMQLTLLPTQSRQSWCVTDRREAVASGF
jgi:hypothetical protein